MHTVYLVEWELGGKRKGGNDRKKAWGDSFTRRLKTQALTEDSISYSRGVAGERSGERHTSCNTSLWGPRKNTHLPVAELRERSGEPISLLKNACHTAVCCPL